MFDKVLELIKTKNLVVPGSIFYNMSELGINHEELYIIIYIINLDELEFDMVKMSKDLGIKPKEVLKVVNSLVEKDYLKLDVIKNECNAGEYFNLDGLYRKMTFNIIGKEEEKTPVPKTLYDEFEQEFKRPLTPMEFQIIDAWKEVGYTSELIILALKEAAYNGAYSVTYIDKVLSAWDKKGIKSAEDVAKNKQDFKRKNIEPTELEEEYDWLNE